MVNNFINNFQQIEFPKLGYIKIPKYIPTQEECKFLGVKKDIKSNDFLIKLIRNGFKEKLDKKLIPLEKEKEYQDRINLEFETYKKFQFIDYVLLIYSIISFCKKNEILNSPARGSCAGSCILYMIGITTIDPIRYDLLFERFISSSRTETKEIDGELYISSASLPDVDIDSDNRYKPLMNKFLQERFPNKTCKISTFLTLQSKIAIKDCGKIMANKSEEEMMGVGANVEILFGINDSLTTTLQKSDKLKEWVNQNQWIYDTALKLEGLIRGKSIHASGIFISNEELNEQIPTELSVESELTTSYDMGICSLLGIKVDNLGLKNLGAIHNCLQLIDKKLEDLDVNDPEIYNYLNNSNNTHGIFQCEDGLGKSTLMKIKPRNIDEINLAIAMSRPGCFKFVDEYVRRRDTGDYKILPQLEHILKPTFGIIAYQEELMRLSVAMGKFSPQESNAIRSAVGKKDKVKMLSYKEKFIKQSIENGYEKEFVQETWDSFEASGSYLFCMGHACGYGNLTAITTLLKVKHPLEYFLSMLKYAKYEANPIDEISKIHKEMVYFNIKLLPPSLQVSELDFTIEGENIRFGLSSIKGISDKTMEKFNNFKRKFANKFELFEAAKEAGLGIGTLGALIMAGCLESISTNRTYLVYESQLYNLLTDKEKRLTMQFSSKYDFKVRDIINALVKELKDEKGKFYIKESRFETIKKKAENYKNIYNQNSKNLDVAKWFYEYNLTGFVSSKKLINIFEKYISSLKPISEVNSEISKSRIEFVGIINEDGKLGTSKKGAKYASYFIGDESGNIKVMIFNDALEQCKLLNARLPKECDIVIIKGTKMDEETVFANSISIQDVNIFITLADLKRSEKEDEKESNKSS